MPIDTPIQLTQGQFNEEMNKIWKNHMSKPVKYTRNDGPNGDGFLVPGEGDDNGLATPIKAQMIQFTPKNFFELFMDKWKDEKSDSIGPFVSPRNAVGAVTGGLWLQFSNSLNPNKIQPSNEGKFTLMDFWNPTKELEIHWINRRADEGERAEHDDDYYRLNEIDFEFLSVGWIIYEDRTSTKESDVAEINISQNCLNLKNMEASKDIYFYLGDSLEDFNKLQVQSPDFFNWLNWVQNPMGASK